MEAIKCCFKENNNKINKYLLKNDTISKEEEQLILSSKISSIDSETMKSVILKTKYKKKNEIIVNFDMEPSKLMLDYEKYNKDERYDFKIINSALMKTETKKIIKKLLNNMHTNLIKINLLSPHGYSLVIDNLPCTTTIITISWQKVKMNYLPNSITYLKITNEQSSNFKLKSAKLLPQYFNNSIIMFYSNYLIPFNKIPIHIKKMLVRRNPVNTFSAKKNSKLLRKYRILGDNYTHANSPRYHKDYTFRISCELYLSFFKDYNYDQEKDFFIKENIE
jgi:hypothetical protein